MNTVFEFAYCILFMLESQRKTTNETVKISEDTTTTTYNNSNNDNKVTLLLVDQRCTQLNIFFVCK